MTRTTSSSPSRARASLAVRSILDEQDTTVVCNGQPASRTTAPLTLDALARAEVGPVDVFASAGAGARPWRPTRASRCSSPAARRPFIQLQRTLGQFEPEVIKVAIVVDDDAAGRGPPRRRPRAAARARAHRPAPGAVLGSPGMSGWPPPDEPAPTEAPGFATALRGGAPRRARRPRDADEPGRWRRLVPTRDALVDAAFAAVLVTIALVGLRTGFLGPQWMVAAGRRARCSAWSSATSPGCSEWLAVTTLVVLVAVYFLLGGPVAVRTHLVGGVLPTGRPSATSPTWAVPGLEAVARPCCPRSTPAGRCSRCPGWPGCSAGRSPSASPGAGATCR